MRRRESSIETMGAGESHSDAILAGVKRPETVDFHGLSGVGMVLDNACDHAR
jgi:hypothetical protein